MTIKFIPEGQDFSFPTEFGFTGSAQGRHDPKRHSTDADDDEYGDGTFLGKAKGGGVKAKLMKRAMGGPGPQMQAGMTGDTAPTGGVGRPAGAPVTPIAQGQTPIPGGPMQSPMANSQATISMPISEAAQTASKLLHTGAQLGAHATAQQIASRLRGQAAGGAAPALGANAAMAKGGAFNPGGKKGKLHRELGVPEGQKIPAARLRAATRSPNPEIRRDATRAETMAKWDHSGGKKG